MPSTSLWDLVQVYDYFMGDKNNPEKQLQNKLAENEALWKQKLGFNRQVREQVPEGLTQEQQLLQMSDNPNVSQYILPQFTSSTVNNVGKMNLERLKTQLNPPPRYTNIKFPAGGAPVAFDAQAGVGVNLPTAEGFQPPPMREPMSVNVNVRNLENDEIDKAMGKLAPQYFDEFRNRALLTEEMHRSIKNIDEVLEGEPTGAFADKLLGLQKAAQSVGLTPPELNQSIGKREYGEMLAITNAMKMLQNFKGQTTDFEFRKAYEANPNLLTTVAGRKQALAAIQRDRKRTASHYNQAITARKNKAFDATFQPIEKPEGSNDQWEPTSSNPEAQGVLTLPNGDQIRVDPVTGKLQRKAKK